MKRAILPEFSFLSTTWKVGAEPTWHLKRYFSYDFFLCTCLVNHWAFSCFKEFFIRDEKLYKKTNLRYLFSAIFFHMYFVHNSFRVISSRNLTFKISFSHRREFFFKKKYRRFDTWLVSYDMTKRYFFHMCQVTCDRYLIHEKETVENWNRTFHFFLKLLHICLAQVWFSISLLIPITFAKCGEKS